MLCDFSHEFPEFVADFLDINQHFPKRKLREETITDMMMAHLKIIERSFKPATIIVDIPNEQKTGADMEWNFVSVANGKPTGFFRIYIQAKKLEFTSTKTWKPNSWKEYRYKEFWYTPRNSQLTKQRKPLPLQIKVLIDNAKKEKFCLPLYAFYNPRIACDEASADNVRNIKGVNLAFAESIYKGIPYPKKGIPYPKRKYEELQDIQPYFFLLEDLFCCHWGGGRILLPQMIRDRLYEIEESVYQSLPTSREGLDARIEIPEIATEGNMPSDILEIVERHFEKKDGETERERLNRWRITFISSAD